MGEGLTNERGERGGQESREAASLAPLTLLFIPPPTGMLLRSDHRHLKNNLMHGCSSPTPSSLPPLSQLFSCCSLVGLYQGHNRICGIREKGGSRSVSRHGQASDLYAQRKRNADYDNNKPALRQLLDSSVTNMHRVSGILRPQFIK